MRRERIGVPGVVIALLVAVALPLGGGSRAAGQTTSLPGRWVFDRLVRDPAPSEVSRITSVTHDPGVITKRYPGQPDWPEGDRWPVATFAATYAVPPVQLIPGRPITIDVAVTGRLESNDIAGSVGIDVIQLENGTWTRAAVGTSAGCGPDPFPLGPLGCRQPAPATGTFTFRPPTTGTTYSLGFGVLNEQSGLTWVYRYDRSTTTTSTSTSSTSTSTSTSSTSTSTSVLPARPKPPVILLPGVAGTVLATPDAFGFASETVWPLDQGARQDMEMDASGLPLHDVRVLEILMSVGADYYGGMVEYLRKEHGYTLGRDLFTFPYDWRRSNVFHLAALDRMIDEALAASGQKQVVLLAHSMGGLIARGYVLSRPERAAKVDAVVTMGTPFWGSPKVFYALVAGYTFGNPLVFASTMKVLIQNFPATYQLLPHRPFVWDDRRERYLTVDETMQIEYERLELVPYAPTAVSAGSQKPNPDLMALAKGFHTIGGSPSAPRPMPAGVELYAILGVGVRTLDEFALRAPRGREEAIRLGADPVVLEPLFGDGDGTVPLANLEIDDATATYYLPWQEADPTAHGDLPSSARVQGIVGRIVSGVAPPSAEHPYLFSRPATRNDPDPGVDFTLRSDAHLQVRSGARVLGGIDDVISETLPGTFLRLNGVEYAALPAATGRAYDVLVTGITTGSFDLAVRRVTEWGTTAIEFSSVPVVDGSSATVTLDPRSLSRTPSMEVRSAGDTRQVAPVVVSTGAEPGSGGSSVRVGLVVVVVVLAAFGAGLALVLVRARARKAG